MSEFHNILFYKFVDIESPEQLRDSWLEYCKQRNILGRILVASEGVNGNITAPVGDAKAFMEFVQCDERFSDVDFKIGPTDEHNFHKMIVRVRPEIVTFKRKIDMSKKAPYISPKELKELLDKEEEIILIDARNSYESEVGKFKGAITPNLELFSDFADEFAKRDDLKDKKIVTYCTGGIRCEKFSAALVEQGFTNVQQLHNGILRYGDECGSAHWEGKCFVFDGRKAVPLDGTCPACDISSCVHCEEPESNWEYCNNPGCDKRFVVCPECVQKHSQCCSKACEDAQKSSVNPLDMHSRLNPER